MQQPLNRFLLLQPVWLPTVLFIPLLYALGWLAALPLTLLGLPTDQLSLTGTVLSFVLFLALMHRWVAVRWSAEKPWAALGICRANPQEQPTPAAALLKGLLIAAGLLTVITSVVLLEGSGDWRGEVDATQLTNAVLLCLGVGFAEELIFRSWLWTELHQRMSSRRAALAQAGVFSLVHTRFNLGLGAMSGLLVGLFLLAWCWPDSVNRTGGHFGAASACMADLSLDGFCCRAACLSCHPMPRRGWWARGGMPPTHWAELSD